MAQARQVAMYLAATLALATDTQIGAALGRTTSASGYGIARAAAR